jgi:hypothetical protein
MDPRTETNNIKKDLRNPGSVHPVMNQLRSASGERGKQLTAANHASLTD